MKGLIYENSLPRGMQVKKDWEPLVYMHFVSIIAPLKIPSIGWTSKLQSSE
jgi:hypothetical protein